MRQALVVMGKAPRPGQVKTRLVASGALSAEAAAELYRCFLADTLELASSVADVDLVLSFTPVEEEPFLRSLAPPAYSLVTQQGETLNQRLTHLFDHHFDVGYGAVVVVGSDFPTLPVAYLGQAFVDLARPDVDLVLGPSDDGGYYLIGLKRPHPSLLLEVSMSTSSVLQDTVEVADAMGLGVALIPAWYDVDTGEDLARLRAELKSNPLARAPRTRSFLAACPSAIVSDGAQGVGEALR